MESLEDLLGKDLARIVKKYVAPQIVMQGIKCENCDSRATYSKLTDSSTYLCDACVTLQKPNTYWRNCMLFVCTFRDLVSKRSGFLDIIEQHPSCTEEEVCKLVVERHTDEEHPADVVILDELLDVRSL